MAWVKLHDDILGDPKLIRAVRAGHAQLVLLPWLFVFAKQADDGGRLSVGGLPADPEDIAHQLPGVSAADVAVALASLEAIGVLRRDGEFLTFVRWSDRQDKPSNSKAAIRERVQRHRAKGKQAQVTPRNALQGDAVTPCNATEKRREEGEEKRKDSLVSPGATVAHIPRPASPDVETVVAHYLRLHPRRRPSDKDRKLIARRLMEYTPPELCEALDGNATDPWCIGIAKHELEYVLRDNGQVDTFRGKLAASAPRLAVDPATGIPNAIGMAALSGGRA
jgi:hypothetical protein